MTEHSASGTMAGLATAPEAAGELIARLPVLVAGYNGPEQTVIAGTAEAIEEAGRRAAAAGTGFARLAVSHAFHSPLVAPAADAFAARLAGETFGPVGHRVISTVTGEALAPGTDIPGLLRAQITEPVLFAQAVGLASKDIDLFVEVGPGRVLSRLAETIADVLTVALDTDGESLDGLLSVAAAACVAGASLRHDALFRGRLVRPLEIGAEFSFLTSPCEAAPALPAGGTAPAPAPAPTAPEAEDDAAERPDPGEPTIEVLRWLVAERAELPPETVSDDDGLLDGIHLSSITVGQIMNEAARRLRLPVTQAPTNFATATLRELAETLDTLAETAQSGDTSAP